MPHSQMTGSLLQALGVPQELALEFFITFARFEYALKRAGFVQGDNTKVSPDWDGFARELAKMDNSTLAPVLSGCQYLRDNPPQKQVLNNGQVSWVQPNRQQSEIENTLLNVRTVRNNVFHGGKFPVPSGPVAEPLRDQRLLEDCLAVLSGLLELPGLPKRIGDYFPPGS